MSISPTTSIILLELMAFVWGAVWGSFLNVVIYRLPRDLSVVRPPSHCGACETPIRWYDNLPCISYLILRGRCRNCEATYSPRYMLVELTCGILALALFRATVLPISPLAFGTDLLVWLWLLSFIFALIAITFIDLEHFYIPDVISYPFIAVGLIGAALSPHHDLLDRVFGAVGGSGFMLAIAGIGWLMFKREAMGLGDVKLIALIGAFLGWQALPFVLFASAIQALVAVMLVRLYSRITGKEDNLTMSSEELDEYFGEEDRYDPEEVGQHTVIPYGPFLALAALEALLFGHDLVWTLAESLASVLIGV